MLSKAEVLAALSTFAPTDLAEILASIKALNQFNGNKPDARAGAKDEVDCELVLQAIITFMHTSGLEFPSMSTLKRASCYPSFCRTVPGLITYINTAAANRQEQLTMLGIGVELLHHNLVEIYGSADARSIMRQIHRVPSLINKAFPGYAQGGLLGMILRSEGMRRKTAR